MARRPVSRVVCLLAGLFVIVALFATVRAQGQSQAVPKYKVDPDWPRRQVYGDFPVATSPARAVEEVVPVDLRIYGCPVRKEEVERLVTELVLGKTPFVPKYPVCMECKALHNLCLFELGEVCLGPVTRAGCEAWCPSSRMGCWGCRGPSEPANLSELAEVAKRFGVKQESLLDRLECFGGFAVEAAELRQKLNNPGGKSSGGQS